MDVHGASAGLVLGLDPRWVAGGLFVATYAVIMTERLNRAIVALFAAGLMIFAGVLNQEAALEGVDFNTLGLLTGMMVIVAVTKRSGVFQYLAIWSAKRAQARPWGILVMLALVTALLSAFLDNVTTVLLIAPVTLLIAEELRVSVYPYLFSEIMASNIGGTATLIGDPPNIMIGSAVGLSFNDFVVNLAPVVALVLAATLVPIYLIWGRSMQADEEHRQRVMSFDERQAISDPRLLKQSLTVLGLVLAAFVFAHPMHLEPATIAMFGAATLLLLANWPHHPDEQARQVHHAFSEVEWVTIFFFVGLFIVVAGVEHAGLLRWFADEVLSLTGGDLAVTAIAILWASAILSAIIDNIPFVATMIPVIQSMAPSFGGPEGLLPLWWSLSLGACLGGNGSLIGASANLTVAGIAERAGVPFRFMTFLKYAFPMMLMSVAVSTVYVYLRFL
jgi:Na+/H+ antiporter NhaD/arsenite permease-like protein